jgi:predicted RNA binding protein YcfA (HicA-like mRNA interferase family)
VVIDLDQEGNITGIDVQAIACHTQDGTHSGFSNVIRLLVASGWYLVRTKGSHRHFRHLQRRGTVTVPHPVRGLPKGTVRSIERQSGVRLRSRGEPT